MNDSPNILFIFPDQWRYDGLSALGHPTAETPFLDDLMAGGTRFDCAYSNSPTCIPARACLMTGQTPAGTGRHGYQDGQPWPYRDVFPRLLRDAGYQTLLAGKTHFHPPRAHLGFEQLALYDNQRWSHDFQSDYDRWLADKTGGQIQDTAQQLHSNAMIVQPWTHDESLHASSWTVTVALDMLQRRDPTRPFLLQLGFHRPHPPLDPPVEYWRRFEHKPLPKIAVGDWARHFGERPWQPVPFSGQAPQNLLDRTRRAYYAQLAHLDFQIGRMLRHLQLHGILHNTLIVFASDHGEMLGDHHLFSKMVPSEAAARVPLIITPPPGWRWPGGQCVDRPVALHDLMSTLLEAGGVSIPDAVEGRSLLPFVRGESPDWREFIHFEHCHSQIGPWQALSDGTQKYVWQTETGEEWLFDLANDPDETRNLAGDPAWQEALRTWRGRLAGQLTPYAEYGLVKDGKLVPGSVLPQTEEWVQREDR